MKAGGPRRESRLKGLWRTFAGDVEADDLRLLFTRDARDAWRMLEKGIDPATLARLSPLRRLLVRARLAFLAFSMKLSPARRLVFGLAVALALIGLLELYRGFSVTPWPVVIGGWTPRIGLPVPSWASGTEALALGFLLMNLLVLLEVADRLTLKNDLEIAREIQQAMLPHATHDTPDLEAFGLTRPANTVGGDFYDILPLPDGRLVVAIGDVAGKGSPASLLMAVLLAMFRTLVDERMEPAALACRLNVQVARHTPASRFITLFFGCYEPATGRLVYVNAGQTPPLAWRRSGRHETLLGGGMALGMFDQADYEAHETVIAPGDLLVMYSDGVTEAENHLGQMFDESGLRRAVAAAAGGTAQQVASSVLRDVETFAREVKLADDLTLLVLRRLDSRIVPPPLPAGETAPAVPMSE